MINSFFSFFLAFQLKGPFTWAIGFKQAFIQVLV